MTNETDDDDWSDQSSDLSSDDLYAVCETDEENSQIRYGSLESAPKSVFDHLKREAAKYPVQTYVIDKEASDEAGLDELMFQHLKLYKNMNKQERTRARDEMIEWIIRMRNNNEGVPDTELHGRRLVFMHIINCEATYPV